MKNFFSMQLRKKYVNHSARHLLLRLLMLDRHAVFFLDVLSFGLHFGWNCLAKNYCKPWRTKA